MPEFAFQVFGTYKALNNENHAKNQDFRQFWKYPTVEFMPIRYQLQ